MFSLREVLLILSYIQQIAEESLPAFRARLKTLQGLGFPKGANPGKGRHVQYAPWQVLYLHLALEMEQLGMAPETIVELFDMDEEHLREAIDQALKALDDETSVRFLHFDPNALSHLAEHGSRSRETLLHSDLSELRARLDSWPRSGMVRLALVDLSAGIRFVVRASELVDEEKPVMVLNALKAWAARKD